MGGSITYRDGRKQTKWFVLYEYREAPEDFEPLPKMKPAKWSVW